MDNAGNILSYYIYDGVGLVAKMTSQSIHFYHYDGLGSTIAMTDASGNMVNKYAYDAFGGLLNATETVSNPFLYVGQFGVMDEDNGLLYMRARYYDPEVGRFINKDPIGFAGGLNPYGYARNNPINYIDPTGEYAWLTQLLQRIAASPAFQRATIFIQRFGSQVAALFRSAPPQCTNIVNVTFGHGARHLQGTGLSQQLVENAITQQIQLIMQQASTSGAFWGAVEVAGRTVIYRAFTLATGTVHVGTYYPF
jgi:RHS repeat-associated protein